MSQTSTSSAFSCPTPSTITNNEEDVYIGLDVGTQSTKGLLYHPHSNTILGRSSVQYDLSPNPNNVIGRAEQSPALWIDAVTKVVRDLSARFNLDNDKEKEKQGESWILKGIGVSGQQHGMVALTPKFQPVRDAKLWCDVEAAEEANDFSTQATALFQQVGEDRKWSIPPGFTAPKVAWFRNKEEKLYNGKTRWIVLPHDYVNLFLLGATIENEDMSDIVPTTDAGDASGSGVFDPITRSYDKRLANIIDPSGKYYNALPKILPPNASCGTMHAQIKQKLNIDITQNRHDVHISVGSGDNMCSALGCGCVSPGMAVLSLGTSGTIFGVSEEPVTTGTEIAPFCDATGRHLPLACVMSCTGVLNSVLENLCCEDAEEEEGDETEGKRMTHEEATKLAALHPPGCYGMTFLPYLGGERTPNWPHAFGSLLGLSSQNMKHFSSKKEQRMGLFYRLAMEGVTYLLADSLELMKNACTSKGGESGGFNPKRLLVVGGGSKNKLWRQMIADVLDLELCFPLEAESAALGAAFQAGAAATKTSVEEFVSKQKIEMEDIVVKPTEDEEVKRLYQDGLKRYKTWSRQLFELD